ATRMDGKGAPLVPAQRPHPGAAEVSGRFAELSKAAGGAGWRRLQRQRACLLVLRQGDTPEAAGAEPAVEGLDAFRPAAGLQRRARRPGQDDGERRRIGFALSDVVIPPPLA